MGPFLKELKVSYLPFIISVSSFHLSLLSYQYLPITFLFAISDCCRLKPDNLDWLKMCVKEKGPKRLY